ncbi:unnamed protein product [Aspergillus oryzae var. brunneus]|uniref:Queuosine 5'-phosphate N-glycosylase/hydrolase n=2 Tax=Aspergillus oryzae TaxID=5062 RepID=A0AAN5BU66_ASPOZ|nr:unnamed protein product [Aspergillus oryzae]GMG25231.1 unnamed protein product [Aspergillus oryzae]GMG41834.1 unnamed protein product [Aspergillus oryzae var. brunneus]
MARALANSMILTKSQCLQVRPTLSSPPSATISQVLMGKFQTNHDPDYRIPQILNHLGCLMYSPPLESHIRDLKPIPSGSTWEVELRATSIWCVELIRREIVKNHPDAKPIIKPTQPNGHAVGVDRRQSLTTSALDEQRKCTTQKHITQISPAKPASSGVNAILIDFFLYDSMKELEKDGKEQVPHHRTRSIWY